MDSLFFEAIRIRATPIRWIVQLQTTNEARGERRWVGNKGTAHSPVCTCSDLNPETNAIVSCGDTFVSPFVVTGTRTAQYLEATTPLKPLALRVHKTFIFPRSLSILAPARLLTPTACTKPAFRSPHTSTTTTAPQAHTVILVRHFGASLERPFGQVARALMYTVVYPRD